MENIVLNRIYSEERSPDAPFGVELLIDCSESDPTQGSSEMHWFESQSEQDKCYEELSYEYIKK